MKRNLKSIISFLVVCMLMVGMFVPVVSFAQTPASYNINIAKNEKFFKLTEDSIAVFSTRSKKITPAILSESLTADGYSVSYADSDKVDNTTEDSIENGFVKLTPSNGGDAVYIPIVSKIAKTTGTQSSFEGMHEYNVKNSNYPSITYSETTGSIGGKGASDTSAVFEVSSNGELSTSTFWPRLQMPFKEALPHTYVFNVYADGDASANIAYSSSTSDKQVLFRWTPDGKLYYGKYDASSTTGTNIADSSIVLERGKWHRLAFSYDPSRNRIEYYVDGQLISDDGKYIDGNSMNSGSNIFFGVSSTGAVNSCTVAYDDMQSYYGAYTDANGKNDGIVNLTDSATLYYDEAKNCLVYDEYVYATPDALEAAVVSAGANSAVLYADSTLITEAEVISDEDNILVVTSKDSMGYGYYRISEMGENLVVSFDDIGLTETSSSIQLFPDDYKIAVYSEHPDDWARDIGSAAFINALSSTKGYTLSYVDADKNVPEEEVKPVKDGFVKAVSAGGRTVYIPVVTTGADISDNFGDLQDNSVTTTEFNVEGYKTSASGLGGKSDTDYAQYTLSFPETATTAQAGIKYVIPGNIFTAEFNVYTDGDTGFAVNVKKDDETSQKLFVVDSDGNYNIYMQENANTPSKMGSLKTGRWHKLAISYDMPRGRFFVYLDGKKIANDAAGIWSPSKVQLFIVADKGCKSGKIAIDDFKLYYGYCRDVSMGVAFEAPNELSLFDNVIYSGETDASKLISLIKANADGADEVRVYKDSSFVEEATTITNDSVVVIVAQNKAINYYSINNEKTTSITFSVDSGFISASAKVMYGKDAQLIIASYNDKEMIACDVVDAPFGEDAIAEIAYVEGYKVKAFIWEKETIKPILASEYNDDL